MPVIFTVFELLVAVVNFKGKFYLKSCFRNEKKKGRFFESSLLEAWIKVKNAKIWFSRKTDKGNRQTTSRKNLGCTNRTHVRNIIKFQTSFGTQTMFLRKWNVGSCKTKVWARKCLNIDVKGMCRWFLLFLSYWLTVVIFKGKFMSFPVLETNKKKGHFLNKGQELQEEKEKTRKINFSWKTDKEKQTNCFTKKSGTYQSRHYGPEVTKFCRG